MSASRAFLSTSRLMRVPTRGKALANWARPSIDEMGVPTGSWAAANAKCNTKGNLHLAVGLVSISIAIAALNQNVFFNGTPHHLLK